MMGQRGRLGNVRAVKVRAVLTPPRRRLLAVIAEAGRSTVRELAQRGGWRSHSTTWAHLVALRAAGLVQVTPVGYQLAPGVVVSRGGMVGAYRPLRGGEV